ncbi:MAG: hypothetical protein RBT57_10560 [Paludibacter sp.]|jgi:hypothetical protein|nr:hypothetical protein [Paludibacter sp.]
MNRLFIPALALLFILSSCEKREPSVYEYEAEPVYTWGYADFWGNYYGEYGISENVLSLSLLTKELSVDSTSNLVGIGQYLYLEDIFVAASDTLLPEGTYAVSKNSAPFNIAPGEILEIDGQKLEVGAFVYFLEKNPMFTIMKYIQEGTMKVAYSGNNTRLDFDFTLDDKTTIKGRFEGQLPYFDARYFNLGDAAVGSRYSASVKTIMALFGNNTPISRLPAKRSSFVRF